MEYAILAGLAGLGYAMNLSGKERRLDAENLPGKPLPVNVGAVGDQVHQPPTRLPPPREKLRKAQAYSTLNSQRRIELFTGAPTESKFPKTEIPGGFAPAEGIVTSAGTVVRGDPADVERAAAISMIQHGYRNGVPTGIRVGPGLGIDPNAVNSGDGFHPMFRVLPELQNSYRLHNLGELPRMGGKAFITSERPDRGDEAKDLLPRVWARAPGDAPTGVAAVAATVHPYPHLKGTARDTPNAVGAGRMGPRGQSDRSATYKAGFKNTVHDVRALLPTPGMQTHIRPREDGVTRIVRPVKRDSTGNPVTGSGAVASAPGAPPQETRFLLKGVAREEEFLPTEHGVMAAASTVALRLPTVPKAKQTLREPRRNAGARERAGPVRPGVVKVSAERAHGQYVAAGSGAHKQTEIGKVRVAKEPKPQRQGIPAAKEQAGLYAPMGGWTTTYNKVPSANPRLFVR